MTTETKLIFFRPIIIARHKRRSRMEVGCKVTRTGSRKSSQLEQLK